MIYVRKKAKKMIFWFLTQKWDGLDIFGGNFSKILMINQKSDSIRKCQSFQLKNSSTAENSFPIHKNMAADLL